MTLDDEFADIRINYFPRWDKARDWKIAYGTVEQLRHNTGYCDAKTRTIYLDSRTFPRLRAPGQRAFIIHEICHDVGAAFHNRKWASRMELAAKRADSLREPDVAEILRSDIYSYFGNGLALEYTSDGIREYATDVLQHNPSIGFEKLLKRVAKFFGYRVSKLDRDFGADLRVAVAMWHTE